MFAKRMRYVSRSAKCDIYSLRSYVKRAPTARNYIITPSFHVPSRDISHRASGISRMKYISRPQGHIAPNAGSRKQTKNFSEKGEAGVKAERLRTSSLSQKSSCSDAARFEGERKLECAIRQQTVLRVNGEKSEQA